MVRRLRMVLALIACVALLALSPGARAEDAPHDQSLSTTQSGGVTREVIGSGLPAGAPGQELVLLRYTFEPGAVIPPHIHPGMQTAYVLSGTLNYTVLCGHALLTLPPAAGSAPETMELDPGPEITMQPGTTFVEVEGIVHVGRNPGPDPLVLLVASLLANDEPPSIPVDPQTAPQCAAENMHT